MPMLRPFAALVAASIAASACAAGGHNPPEEDERAAAGRDSLVTGSAVRAAMPFPGSVYPTPASHHRVAEARPAAAAEADTGHSAVPAPAAAAMAGTAQPVRPEAAQPVVPAPEPPAADTAAHEDHSGHP